MSGARPDTWMPFYVGDYLRDTQHLNAEKHGAYLLLILAYWASGKPLPDDDEHLSTIARTPFKRWRELRPTLERFFQINGGVWGHKRIDAELQRASDITEKRRAAGIARAQQASSKRPAHAEQVLQQTTQQTGRQSQSQSPIRVNTREIINSLGAISRGKHLGPNYDDPAERKARWQQKMFAEVRNRLPTKNAEIIIQGYLAGEREAIEFIEEVDASLKARRAQGAA